MVRGVGLWHLMYCWAEDGWGHHQHCHLKTYPGLLGEARGWRPPPQALAGLAKAARWLVLAHRSAGCCADGEVPRRLWAGKGRAASPPRGGEEDLGALFRTGQRGAPMD